MAAGNLGKMQKLLASKVRVPKHVVHRPFAHETVVLNLETGRYHGLNPTAGLMLIELERGGTVSEVATRLAASNGWEVTQVVSDLYELCASLVERGLIEFVAVLMSYPL
jgi:coenzyme PQQ synthesis protein D (PqqD)